MKLINLILLSGLALGGCGGSKDPVVDGDGDTTPNQPEIDYSALKATPQTDGALVLATPSMLDSHIKNGIRLALGSPFPGSGGTNSSGGAFGSSSSGSFGSSSSNSSSNSSSSGAAGDPNYTDTNIHVAGVDEADYAKYDGRHWFVATRPEYRDYFIADQPGIQIAATDPANASLDVVGHIALEAEWGNIDEMYLVRDQNSTTHLAVIRKQAAYSGYSSSGFFSSSSSSGAFQPFAAASIASSSSSSSTTSSSTTSSSSTGGLPYPDYYSPARNGRLRIQLVDVADPALPKQDWAITIDGSFVDSRRIGDVLYLVTRFNPWINSLRPDYYDNSIRAANEEVLENTPVTALLPHYDVGDGKKPLTTNCYIQEGVSQHMGYAGVIHITAIDLKSQKLVGSQCMNGTTDTLSMSPESLYLTGTVWAEGSKTVIHKFSLGEEGPVYEASGSVQGHITGRSDRAFRLHEHEGDFRIVTTEWQGTLVHRLFILSQVGNQLEVIAQLPNSAQPAPIGKPGEDIYSVRFEAERAYLVTFRQTDPLYAIDLSDRLAPAILGELEIPGFATYMHPLNSRYLFTFGQDADELGRPLGLKAELIDVGDGTPKSVSTLLIGGPNTSSEAIRNLKALSLLPVSDDEWRVALPIRLYESNGNDFDSRWQHNGLQLLSATGLAGDSAKLADAGMLVTESAERHFNEFGGMRSRSVLHDDAVFLAHNNAFWSAKWDTPEQAEGPKAKQLVTCPEEPEPGVLVWLYTADFATVDACSADIVITDGDYQETLTPQGGDQNLTDGCWFAGAAGRAGNYALDASLPGYSSTLVQVPARPSRCGVHTTTLYIPAVPDTEEYCGDTNIPSVVAQVAIPATSSIEPVCEATVEAEQDGATYPLSLNSSYSNEGTVFCEYLGPVDIAGEMTLTAKLAGYQTHMETLFVPREFCRVLTQHRHIDLFPAP